MPKPLVGQQAPAFALEELDGNRVSLKELLGSQAALLLVFLRHLG